ncbi:cmk-1 [Symbiodinium sp. KB8]|nr:cmk-1 [Symbiodinium sp. KB8]
MELVTGGELFKRLEKKSVYTEEEARAVIRTLTDAIAFCHNKGVVHRDLKPENILLTDDSPDAQIKIADFGFAKIEDPNNPNSFSTGCGTPGYVAPEILESDNYGKECDIWSLGVIFFILLCGYPPFMGESQDELFSKIKMGRYSFDPRWWSNVSEEAKDLISHILVVDPSKRFTADDILNHAWFRLAHLEGDLTSTLDELKKFNARRKLKAVGKTVLGAVRMKLLTSRLGGGGGGGGLTPTKVAGGTGISPTAETRPAMVVGTHDRV